MRKLFLIFLALLAAGCNSMPRSVPKVTAVNEPSGLGNTTILRNYNYFGSALHYWPKVDGNVISGIFKNQYVSFNLTVGNHKLGVGCCIGPMAPWMDDQIEITVAEGKRRYFLVSPMILRSAFPEIEEISEEEAITRIAQSERIKTGFISDCDGKPVEATDNAPWYCLGMARP
ncbi:MAG TPA: hypothetical protein VFK88_01255 [Gallionella sp.]|nr:hypothetical protein [Gallionella sp.]